MIQKTIFLLAAAFALYKIIKVKKPFPALITLGMIAGVPMVMFIEGPSYIWGIYVYMGSAGLAFIYGLIVKDKLIGERIIICGLSASMFGYWLWTLNHWHGNTLVVPILALGFAMYAISKKVNLKNELSFLVILIADAVAILVEAWMKG